MRWRERHSGGEKNGIEQVDRRCSVPAVDSPAVIGLEKWLVNTVERGADTSYFVIINVMF